jgi:hypothetical protein
MTSFEIDTQYVVNTFLNYGESAKFEFGTLFAKCSEDTIDNIINHLTDNLKLKTQVSQFGNQFAIDFVA